MSLDLVALLRGAPVADEPRPDAGDVVTRLRCPCGAAVALLSRRGGASWLWLGAYRHTPRGVAEILTWAALEDFENIAEHADEDQPNEAELVAAVETITALVERDDDALAAVLPHMRMPARVLRVTGLQGRYHITAGCPKCRRVADVGPLVVDLEAAADPPRDAVVSERAGVANLGYEWPADATLQRVALYKHLNGVLDS